MTIKNLDTLIVGCGNIAGAFDFGRDGLPSTHAGAYSQHGRFNITACVDPDKKKLDNFIAHLPQYVCAYDNSSYNPQYLPKF